MQLIGNVYETCTARRTSRAHSKDVLEAAGVKE